MRAAATVVTEYDRLSPLLGEHAREPVLRPGRDRGRARAHRLPPGAPLPAGHLRRRRGAAGAAGRRPPLRCPLRADALRRIRARTGAVRVPPHPRRRGQGGPRGRHRTAVRARPTDDGPDLRRPSSVEPRRWPRSSSGRSPPARRSTTAKAQLFVTVDVDTLVDGLRGAGATVGGTTAGTLLAPETIRRLACDASLIPVVLARTGRSWTGARRDACSPQPRPNGSGSATAAVPTRAATHRRTGPRATIWSTGRTAAPRTWATPRCSADTTTPPSTPDASPAPWSPMPPANASSGTSPAAATTPSSPSGSRAAERDPAPPRPSRRGLWHARAGPSVEGDVGDTAHVRRTHHATRMSAATLRVTGTHHGPVDLLRDRLSRRLHRGPGGQLRLGRSGRRGPHLHQRPRTADPDLPLRAPHVRGDGGLGDRPDARRPVARHEGLRAGVAGGREGRLLDDAGAAVHRPDPDRARLRPRGGPADESVGEADISVGGPDLAGHAITAGLVDEYHLFVTPIVVGGGTQALPDGVRIDLELLDERRFASGVVHLRYRLRAQVPPTAAPTAPGRSNRTCRSCDRPRRHPSLQRSGIGEEVLAPLSTVRSWLWVRSSRVGRRVDLARLSPGATPDAARRGPGHRGRR